MYNPCQLKVLYELGAPSVDGQALLQWVKLLSDESRSLAEHQDAMQGVENLVNTNPQMLRAMWKEIDAAFRTQVFWPNRFMGSSDSCCVLTR